MESFVDEEGTLHEALTLRVSVRGACLGESFIDPGAEPALGYRRGGVCYFCPECSEVWAQLEVFDRRGIRRASEVFPVSCIEHRSAESWEVAGSLLSGYRTEGYLRHLPPDALRREFELYLIEE